jgi:hypothetical protein
MSNVLYPIACIKAVKCPAYNRVVADPFEDGSTGTRALWGAKYFKRRIMVTHAMLTPEEYRYLDSFYTQRDGGFDAFWFRDNANRRGNAYVRFASPLPAGREGMIYPELQVDLEEMAPIRMMPGIDEIEAAAGSPLSVYYDANRETFFSHTQNVSTAPQGVYSLANYTDPNGVYDAAYQRYPMPWQAGGAANIAGVSSAQWQQYHFDGTGWARSASNVADFATGAPAWTAFAIVQHNNTTSQQVIFAVGSASGGCFGLALSAANKYEPFNVAGTVWTACKFSNPQAWTSLAATCAVGTNTIKLYANGVLIGTDTPTYGFVAGKASLGAAPDGTLISNPSNAVQYAEAAHCMAFNATLSLAQIKAVHNLLAYQYGMASV